jgi:hypothetical protein
MGQRCTIYRWGRWLLGAGIASSISLSLSLPYAGATGEGHSVIGSSDSAMTAPATITTETDKRWVSSAPMPGDSTLLLRTLPTVSKPISMGRTTLLPYIGAGFSGGYASEVDRSLNNALSTPLSSSSAADVGLKSLTGQMIPNEVQVGIRFPF